MPRFDDMDDVGKPGKPLKQRRFPWRLWMFALLMTAGAAAGGYYTWQYRQQALDNTSGYGECNKSLTKAQAEASDALQKKTDCITVLDGTIHKSKDLETQLTQLSSWSRCAPAAARPRSGSPRSTRSRSSSPR